MDVRVITHSGEDITVTVETFDSIAFNDKCNDNTLNTVELGGVVLSRIDVKLVQPIIIN